MPQVISTPWLQDLMQSTLPQIPRLAIALSMLIGGWLVAYMIHKAIYAGLKRTTVDDKVATLIGFETGGERGARVERAVAAVIYYLLLAFVLVAFFSYLGITAVTAPLLTVLNDVAGAIPNLMKAVVIGLVGFMVATGARKLIVGLLERVGFEARMQKLSGDETEAAPVQEAAEDDEPTEGKKKKKKRQKVHTINPLTHTIGGAAYWFVLVVTAIPVLEALKVGALAAPLSAAFATVATYLPKVAAAAVLLAVGYVLSRMVRALVTGVLGRIGVDKGMERLGFGRVMRDQSLSGILGAIAMAFVLLHFAISAVGRLDIKEISVPLGSMLDRVYVYMPKLLVGAVLMSIGVVVARVTGNVAARLLAAMGFNSLMVHIGLFKHLSDAAKHQEEESKQLVEQRMKGDERADDEGADDLLGAHGGEGIHTPADIAGVVVGAIVVLLFTRQVLGTMELSGLAGLLDRLIAFLPNVLVAAVLLGAGLWAGGWSRVRIGELTKSSSDRLVRSLGPVAHISIVAFSAMMALQQVGVGRQLIAIAFALLLGSVCLALALAFGLGGRDVAGKILQKEYDRRDPR
ncbi:MAG: mechanosensitive ion channel [Myxococcales bacterium]|nr:mechanosensitive ion channel [Myxococcales bacterium]